MLKFLRWVPSLFLMIVIFLMSATPSSNIPNYGFWDTLVKKGGHMTGYALLAVSYWYGFNFKPGKIWLAWLMALLYAASDEFHQSFTPGRNPSPIDVILFDGGGAAAGLVFRLIWQRISTQKNG
jgi:VanZ family protein